ncbi:MAG: DUF2461 domain-containing protein [Acuticoccus sp.]
MENNDKGWFDANRDTFESAVKAPLTALLELGAATFGGTVWVSRPYRDTRFAKDKSPIKPSLFGAVLVPAAAGGPTARSAGLYAGISAEGVRAAGGHHELSTDQLARYRAALDAPQKAAALKAILAAAEPAMALRGNALKTAPRGFARDHPELALLRMKEMILIRAFPPDACGPGLGEEAIAAWRLAIPLLDWFARHVGPPDEAPARRAARR